MANRNDYIILNKKLDRYAKILEDNTGVDLGNDEVDRRRFGFYIYILEQVCNESDVCTLADAVIDTEFNRKVFERSINDCGVDAIFINEEAKELRLFNFKYRRSFKPGNTQKLNDSFMSTKFLNFAIQEDKELINKYPEDIKNKIYKVSSILNRPNDEWIVELYQVSNDAEDAKEQNKELEHLAAMYSIKVKQLSLSTISSFMTIRPEKIDAKLLIDSDAIMSYSEDNKASAKSFIARVKCSEVLRITCNDIDLRNSINLEDASKLRSSDLDFSVLFDNVRGLVKRSKYNENIANSLKVEPKKFFMYNNGITLIAEDIKSKPLPGNKSIKLELSGMQIVNGGQTLRTIHKFNQDDDGNLENYLYDAEVLVRMFMPDNELNESHKIAEYTNSQNPIKSIDLKSLASEQIEIERYLDEFDIAYARKSGDTGPKDDKEYKYTVNMELLGKLLKAKAGNPDKTTSSVKDMFEGGYNKLFVTNFELTETPELIDMYFNIVKAFKELKIKGNQLKYFYIIYLSYLMPNMSLPELIDKLEKSLNEYLINQPDTTAVKALGSALFKRTLLNALELQLES
ncbi:AIPR family protein [Vibrio vulnificus]|uniref:AIPR family protein n=1 Tax=Vibrio vulnificus TaxID=672 RepID=UPI001029E8F3|nr:AIPR family protein [Vibrio vulnificus]RZQ34604.1 hypothetical protein D8T42_02065 [Vibrio vulnificus]RZQ84824.1 hypothetical protein D8T31_00915 [Vibrio vulnificus]